MPNVTDIDAHMAASNGVVAVLALAVVVAVWVAYRRRLNAPVVLLGAIGAMALGHGSQRAWWTACRLAEAGGVDGAMHWCTAHAWPTLPMLAIAAVGYALLLSPLFCRALTWRRFAGICAVLSALYWGLVWLIG